MKGGGTRGLNLRKGGEEMRPFEFGLWRFFTVEWWATRGIFIILFGLTWLYIETKVETEQNKLVAKIGLVLLMVLTVANWMGIFDPILGGR